MRRGSSEFDVLLISPHIDYNKSNQPILSHADLSNVAPLGLMSIGQHLLKKSFRTKILHLPSEVEKSRLGSLTRILSEYPSKLALIQCHWYLYGGGSVKVADQYKKIFPNSKIFLGGLHASYYWKEILTENKNIDGVILGEGEKVAEILAERITRNQEIQDVKGCAYRSGSKIKCIPPSKDTILNIDDIPLLELDSSLFRNVPIGSFFYICLSRGRCKNRCAYCMGNNPFLNTRRIEHLPISKILEQIMIYKECGVEKIFFGEVEFQKRRFMENLAKKIKEEDFGIYFVMETNPSLLTKETTKKLVNAGFIRFNIGCESGSNGLLQRIQRPTTNEQILAAVKNVILNKRIVLTSWIANLPTETEKDFVDTLSIMKKIATMGGNIYWVENLHIFPGTLFYEKPNKFGIKLLLNTFEKWKKWAIVSKNLVEFNQIRSNPLKYLTHLENNKSVSKMIDRFEAMRKLAYNSVETSKTYLEKNRNLDAYIAKGEIANLDWYKNEGYRMLLF